MALDFVSSGTYDLSQVAEFESKIDTLPDFGGYISPFMTPVDDVPPLNATSTTAYASHGYNPGQGHGQLGQDPLLLFTINNTADYLHREVGIPIGLPHFAEQILPERLAASRTFEDVAQPLEDLVGVDCLDPDIGLVGVEDWV